MASKRYCLVCKESGMTPDAARAIVESEKRMAIVNAHGDSFLVETTEATATAFKATHANWIVEPERWIPKPGAPRPRIRKGPE